jgi:hypothetical protein
MSEQKDIVSKEKVIKCPEYILRASKNYYQRKKQDPEFIEKERLRHQKYREENREKINEQARIRKREKAKLEKEKKLLEAAKQVSNEVSNASNNDVVNQDQTVSDTHNKVLETSIPDDITGIMEIGKIKI